MFAQDTEAAHFRRLPLTGTVAEVSPSSRARR